MVSNSNLKDLKVYNIDTERSILGAFLIDNKTFFKIEHLIDESSFYVDYHIKIYLSIKNLVERGSIANSQTVKNLIDEKEFLNKIDINQYLLDLESEFSAFADIEKFAEHLNTLSTRRRIIKFTGKLSKEAGEDYKRGIDIILEQAEKDFFNISNANYQDNIKTLDSSANEAIEVVKKAYNNTSNTSGVTSGFKDIDSLTGGFQKSDLIILAGRPSMGKTALAVNMIMNSVKNEEDSGALYFSLEMSSEQIAARIISMKSEVSAFKMRSGKITDDEFQRVISTRKKISKIKIFFDDTPSLTITAIRSQIRRLCKRENISIVFIDYLQLVHGVLPGRKFENRTNEISEVTKGLKDIAKEMNIPIVALSQLSRNVEQRDDKRPQLSDLRESGSIEQDADVVMFIYREAYYLMRKQPKEGTESHLEWQNQMDSIKNSSEVIISKQRNGPIGSVKLYFDSNLTIFGDIDSRNTLYN